VDYRRLLSDQRIDLVMTAGEKPAVLFLFERLVLAPKPVVMAGLAAFAKASAALRW
jgi:hypothetical protein